MHIQILQEKPKNGNFIAIHQTRTLWQPKTQRTCLGYLPIRLINDWAKVHGSHHNVRGWIPTQNGLTAIFHFNGKRYKMNFLKEDLKLVLSNDLLDATLTITPVCFQGNGKQVYLNASITEKQLVGA